MKKLFIILSILSFTSVIYAQQNDWTVEHTTDEKTGAKSVFLYVKSNETGSSEGEASIYMLLSKNYATFSVRFNNSMVLPEKHLVAYSIDGKKAEVIECEALKEDLSAFTIAGKGIKNDGIKMLKKMMDGESVFLGVYLEDDVTAYTFNLKGLKKIIKENMKGTIIEKYKSKL